MTFQREIYLRDINVAEHFRGYFIHYNRSAGHRHLVLRDSHSEYTVAVSRQATLSRRQGTICVAEYPAFSS